VSYYPVVIIRDTEGGVTCMFKQADGGVGYYKIPSAVSRCRNIFLSVSALLRFLCVCVCACVCVCVSVLARVSFNSRCNLFIGLNKPVAWRHLYGGRMISVFWKTSKNIYI